MYKFLKSLFCLFLIVLVFGGCRKAALDAFYGRPATLAPPIYQTLQNAGNFTNMLTCIDKAGYTSILSTGGYWTLFAPNDAAFKKANINASTLDVATATKIVTYSLLNSGYTSTTAGNNITGGSIEITQGALIVQNGVTTYLPAYKRRTVYHNGVDTTTVPNYATYGSIAGQNIKVLSQNTPLLLTNSGTALYYDPKDFNNKYIPYFTNYYFQGNGLSAYDYNFFYPSSTFTNSILNFNVLDGSVVSGSTLNGNTICENGVVQEINTVPLPLPSLEKYLTSKSNYSHFYNFMQQYGSLVTYGISPDATSVNQTLTGSTAPVYIKQYSPLLAFAPANENLQSAGGSTYPQYGGYTLCAPNNAAFDAYVNSVLLEHYTSLGGLPQSVIVDFINAHMAQSTIWPSQFNSVLSQNYNRENFRFNANTDIADQMMCSNGIFYGTNKVQNTNVFATVYGRAYLDPNYSMMARVLSYFASFKLALTNPNNKYTVVMIPDATFKALGYNINTALQGANPPGSGFTYQAPGSASSSSGAAIDVQVERVVNLGIYSTPSNELNSISQQGIYSTVGINGIAPEYVKFSNNQFYAAGNQDASTTVTVNPAYTQTTNGIVYYPVASNNTILIPTPVANSAGTDIFNKGQIAPVNGVGGDPFYNFYKFLSNSVLWNATTKGISGIDIGTDYTIFVPSNQAIQDAVNNGWLPGTGTGAVKTPNFAPSAPSDISLVTNFIKYHILKANQVVPDGKKAVGGANYITLLFSNDGNNVLLRVSNNLNNMQVIDGQGRIANVGPVSTIVLADHSVILPIDTYLQYLDSTALTPVNPTPNKY